MFSMTEKKTMNLWKLPMVTGVWGWWGEIPAIQSNVGYRPLSKPKGHVCILTSTQKL